MRAFSAIFNWLRTIDWRGALRLKTPRPCAGLAFTACGGILLGEFGGRCFGSGPLGNWPPGPWIGCAVFFALALSYIRWQRPILLWAMVAAGFATLHLFLLNDPASNGLADEVAGNSRLLSLEQDEDPGSDQPLESKSSSPTRLRARGVILDEPRSSMPTGGSVGAAGGRNWRFTFGLSFAELGGRAWRCRARVKVFWRNGPASLNAGERLELTGSAGHISGPRNPGEFDMAAFLRRRNIRTEIRCSGISDVQRLPAIAASSWLDGLPSLARKFQAGTQQRLTLDLVDDPDSTAVISTLLLGLRSEPGLGDLEPPFQRTGTLHFFAIDGLKLGLIALLLSHLLSLGGLRTQWASLLVLPVLLFYALATGLGPASLRAVIVAAVFVGGAWIDRPARPLNSLGAAAAVILLFDSNQLFDLGFQLTFLVVLSILLLGAPLRRMLVRVGAPDPFLPQSLFSVPLKISEALRANVIGLVCISCAATLGSLPLMLLYFHVISPISLVANVAVFPIAFGIIGLGVMSLAVSLVSHTWAMWINNGNWLLAKAMLATVRFFDAVPGGSFYSALPEWHWEWPAAEIAVLDLQHGARSCHLRAANGDWLLDTGRPFDFQRSVLPFLHSRGSGRVDGLILSQADTYHLAAAPLALADLAPGRLFDGGTTHQSMYQRKFMKVLAEKGRAMTHWRDGDGVVLAEGADLRVLYPPEHPGGRAAGDKALILQMRAAGWRVLFLGDCGAVAGEWVVRHTEAAQLRSDVLVMGAAGEGSQAVPELFRAIAPRLVVQETIRARGRNAGPSPTVALPGITMLTVKSGAITLRVYPDRIEAAGFVDGRSVAIRK